MNLYLVEISLYINNQATGHTRYRLVKANDRGEAEEKCKAAYEKLDPYTKINFVYNAIEIIE